MSSDSKHGENSLGEEAGTNISVYPRRFSVSTVFLEGKNYQTEQLAERLFDRINEFPIILAHNKQV